MPPAPVSVVGVVRRRWVLLEGASGVRVVDGARAALALALRASQGAARLLVPVRVTLPPQQVDSLLAAADALAELGLEVVRFGPREVAVKAVPGALGGASGEELVRVAVRALERGADVVAAWLAGVEPPPLDDDLHEVRTLLATLDEVGIRPESRLWRWEQLP